MTSPDFAIINEFDRPCIQNVCQHVGNGYYRYIHESLRSWKMMKPSNPIDITIFGWHYDIDSVNHKVFLHDRDKESALYPDGKFRYWQDFATEHTFDMIT